MKVYISIFLIYIITTLSCKSDDTNLKKWYADKKDKIIRESNLVADNIDSSQKNNKFIYQVTYYKSSHQFKQEIFKPDGQRLLEAFYSRDKKWRLKYELCENGKIGREEIALEGHPIGPFTWWNCNGEIEKTGIKYKGSFIGHLKIYDQTGKQISDTDYNNKDKFEEIVKNYR